MSVGSAEMSYIGNASDVEQEKNITEFRRNRSNTNLATKTIGSPKISDVLWNDKRDKSEDSDDSEISDSQNFLAKGNVPVAVMPLKYHNEKITISHWHLGAFLLTPSHELSMERAALICEKMNFKGCFSLTKTATGILFKFSSPEDYQAVFKKGFHKVTGARFYKKVAIPCRPQKTFTLFVLDVPEDLPVEDVRHSLYRFNSVVEVVRLVIHYASDKSSQPTEGKTSPSSMGIILPAQIVLLLHRNINAKATNSQASNEG